MKLSMYKGEGTCSSKKKKGEDTYIKKKGECQKPYLYLFFMLLENLCSTEKHGNMSIMTACMHFSGHFTLVLPLHHFLRLEIAKKIQRNIDVTVSSYKYNP